MSSAGPESSTIDICPPAASWVNLTSARLAKNQRRSAASSTVAIRTPHCEFAAQRYRSRPKPGRPVREPAALVRGGVFFSSTPARAPRSRYSLPSKGTGLELVAAGLAVLLQRQLDQLVAELGVGDAGGLEQLAVDAGLGE